MNGAGAGALLACPPKLKAAGAFAKLDGGMAEAVGEVSGAAPVMAPARSEEGAVVPVLKTGTDVAELATAVLDCGAAPTVGWAPNVNAVAPTGCCTEASPATAPGVEWPDCPMETVTAWELEAGASNGAVPSGAAGPGKLEGLRVDVAPKVKLPAVLGPTAPEAAAPKEKAGVLAAALEGAGADSDEDIGAVPTPTVGLVSSFTGPLAAAEAGSKVFPCAAVPPSCLGTAVARPPAGVAEPKLNVGAGLPRLLALAGHRL